MFEFVSQCNIIVVQHQKDQISLHGVRNLITLEEHDPKQFASLYNWKMVPSFEFGSLEEVVAASKRLNATKQEGFVCTDQNFNRIKVKSPLYVQISLLRGKEEGLDARRMLSIIQMNEAEEFLNYFPQFQSLYNQQRERYERLLTYVQNLFDTVKDIKHPKDFAEKN